MQPDKPPTPPIGAHKNASDNLAYVTGLRGFGSRHQDGNAPFTLWNSADNDFRDMTEEERAWVIRAYPGVTIISHNGPSLIIYTLTPPNPVPVTVAGVAAYFVPPDYQDEEIIRVNTRYASPRVPDPLPSLRIPRLTKAKPQEVESILEALSELADVKALNFVDYYLFVELRVNQRQYKIHSLPGIVAGLTTTYHQAEESIWGKQLEYARTRRIVPDAEKDTEDTTGYSKLGPGVRLSSAMEVSSDPKYSFLSRSSTAGVLLQNSFGLRRMTAALHGFPKSGEVFHPDHTSVRIGKIDERWAGLDIALTRLDPSILFSNEEYFGVNPPKRLLYSSQAVRGDWYEADGMTTGVVFFQLRGERLMCPQPRVQLTYRELLEESILHAHAPSGGYAMAGLCGAPIVSADPAIAGVVGFFHLQPEDKKICLCAVLNELIDSGWELAKKSALEVVEV